MVAGVFQRIQDYSMSWNPTSEALLIFVWLHPFSPSLFQMAMSRLQMGSAPRPGPCLEVSEPKQWQWRTLQKWQQHCSQALASTQVLFHWPVQTYLGLDSAGASSCPSSSAVLYATVWNNHTLKSWAASAFLHPSNLHRLEKNWQSFGQTDIHTDAQVIWKVSPCTSRLSSTTGSLDAIYASVSSHGMCFSCCQEKQLYPASTLKKVHLQRLLEQENNLIPPVGMHLLKGIRGQHKTSVHLLCLLKPFLGLAARGRSSHTYKIPCRIWWKLNTEMVIRWRFRPWRRTRGWGRTDAIRFKAKAS